MPRHSPRDIAPLRLPVEPPVSPMLAAPGGTTVPDVAGVAYEPKWDGFRAIVFRSADRVVVQGRGGDDLSYAFPEVVDAIRADLPDRIVLDGELIALREGRADFAAMGARIRPRSEAGGQSIIALARDMPVTLVAFDLLALGNADLRDSPFASRRARLEACVPEHGRVRLTPATRDRDLAVHWFHAFEGGGLDGLIVKGLDAHYAPGKRALVKVKHQRTLDAVVGGWRPHASDPERVGSLLLGLYDASGRLHHVGVASGLSAAKRSAVTEALSPYMLDTVSGHPWAEGDDRTRRPGGTSRWSRGRDQSWHPLVPDVVAEVGYDQFEGDRLRHVASWLRWRPDRDAPSCTFEQVARPRSIDIESLLSGPDPA